MPPKLRKGSSVGSPTLDSGRDDSMGFIVAVILAPNGVYPVVWLFKRRGDL